MGCSLVCLSRNSACAEDSLTEVYGMSVSVAEVASKLEMGHANGTDHDRGKEGTGH